MESTLTEIATQLRDANKKVQLIYAFNGTGKTRLSREFKNLIAPKGETPESEEDTDESNLSRNKILYYNAFTEDLFYWDNDLQEDAEPKLKIQPNSFTEWVLKEQGQDQNIVSNFQHYANPHLSPHFSEDFSEVTFSIERGDDESSSSLKISKGEESTFIWSVFYTLIDQVINILNVPEPSERESNQFDALEYIFIDDPVSSLDENHLIELAVNLAALIRSSESSLRFVITTHNPLFYNVLHNELGLSKGNRRDGCYLLERYEDGTFELNVKYGDSNKSFSYHLHLKQTIEAAIATNQVERYHFTLLRNLYEKTASFLGYPRWPELLPDDKQAYLNRIMQFTSHSTLSSETVAQPSEPEKNTVGVLLQHLVDNYGYWQQGEPQ
ncbi:AAA family ATPase [Pelagicoccus sp. SDUM812005]|uniref:AAA family ATPase n=1 Tax=Pelagicoccus sp. SDUM812005 TaxID=3041257 RepID=UPI00280EBBE8|nr:AAA family ATPase [Pelagicoccus sp. SDUM812005]MDQ8181893.1 AAA family ATPase [Pelagicoccus sp. SDUM812005]